ncbi:MAG: RdgB/HAM1 family non-canonical purine NTP pyrophosphatase [Oscillospiraceae bacterium]|jgi:XTP/dITP diphosphohydrolase
MKLVIATHNKKKLLELKDILGSLSVEVLTQEEAGTDAEAAETGDSFEENARQKAEAVMLATGLPTVADDSGLEVMALGGLPGVHSARYGGETTDEGRNKLLLREMEGMKDRSAKFVSAVCCLFPDGRSITVRGECEGVLLEEPRGEGGFGYDPLFFIPEEGMTMAELPPERKNEISHRAKALRKFKEELVKRQWHL